MSFTYNFEMAAVTATGVLYMVDANDERYVLLTKRSENADAFPGAWCLPGGFLNAGTERVADVIVRETMEEINLTTEVDEWDMFYLDDKPGTDPRYKQVVNVCFCYELDEEDMTQIENFRANEEVQSVKFVSLRNLVNGVATLAFDHNTIVERFAKSGW